MGSVANATSGEGSRPLEGSVTSEDLEAGAANLRSTGD